MSDVDAHSLDLIFLPDGADFRIRWESAAIGVAMSRFIPPFQGGRLQLIVRALELLQDPDYPFAQSERQRQRFQISDSDQQALVELDLWDASLRGRVRADAPQRIGNALYRALVEDPLGAQTLGSARNQATAQGRPLSLRLRLPPGSVELAALPWELLWGDAPTPLLVKSGQIGALVRHLDVSEPLPPTPSLNGPLHMLALVPHADLPEDVRQREAAARQAALKGLVDRGALVVQELSPVYKGALLDAVQNQTPDIVYYYGHGDFAAGAGMLRLDDGPCDIPSLLFLFGGARLVTLFACEGARVDSAGDSLFSGIAPALSAEGVPVVLGMQVSVRVEAALRAAGKVFEALAANRSVQDAVGRARQALFVEERARASWFVPALYIRSAERGPVYLRKSAEPAPPVPERAPQGTSQSITASGGSKVSGVRQDGRTGAQQSVEARERSTIENVTQRGDASADQRVDASGNSAIRDVSQSAGQGEPAARPLGVADRLKRDGLKRRLEARSDEYTATMAAVENTLDPDLRVKLERKAEALAAEIADIEQQIAQIESGAASSPQSEKNTTSVSVDSEQLRRVLNDLFTLSDLRTICFDFGVDYEDLAGDTKTDKVISLITHFRQRGELDQLVARVRKDRPRAGL